MNPNPFGHAALQDLLPAYLADELDLEERGVVAAHLQQCTACNAELEEMRLLLRAFAGHQERPINGQSIADAVMMRVTSGPSYSAKQEGRADFHFSLPLEYSNANPAYDRSRETKTIWSGLTSAPSHATARRQPRSLVAVLALFAVAAIIASLLASHFPGGPGGHTTTLSPVSTQASKPGSWRAAYLGTDGRLHIISAGNDQVMSVLPGANFQSFREPSSLRAGVSADGHYLAYVQAMAGNGSGLVTVVDLATGRVTSLGLMATELHWAPDGSRFVSGVFATESTTFTVTDMATMQSHVLRLNPTSGPQSIARIVGWIDATHLAVVLETGRVTLALASLDLTTEQTTTLTTLDSPPDVYLSPDGMRVFIAPTYWMPNARVVDTTTGLVRELPNITATFTQRLNHLDNLNLAYGGNWAYQWAWEPGTHTIALSLSFSSIPNEGETQPVIQDAGVWLVDVDGDQASNVNRDRYPLAWTPDGRTLFMSDIAANAPFNTGFTSGPTLYTLSPVTSGGQSRRLAQDMAAFFGLIGSGG